MAVIREGAGKISVKALPTVTARHTETLVGGRSLGFASMDAGSPPYMDIYLSIAHASGTISFLATSAANRQARSPQDHGEHSVLSTASTLPQYRRQGVQMALMKARLAEAVRQGCDLAVVMTFPARTPNAKWSGQDSLAYTEFAL
jgi:GNAT superfamily N-acetyltransferase